MRISFILSSLWLSGGVRVVVETANRMSERGHEVILVIPGGTLDPDMDRELSRQVQVIQTPMRRPAGKSNPLALLQLSWQLAQATPTSDFVISTHTPTTPSTWFASRWLHRGVPVWHYQDYLEMFLGRPIETWLLKHALGWHRAALVVSSYAKQELERYRPGQIIVVSEGLSHAEFFKPLPVEQRLTRPGKRTILYLGDMRPRKGWFDFLKAVEQVYARRPDIYLWIVSKEPCQLDLDLPYEFIYRPHRAELARLYASCDVFVSASWWESFGLPPLEAMACGAPVVLTDSRGVREYARPGENCLMTPPQQPAQLAEAILQVINDPQLTARLRQNAPQAAADFTWGAAIDRFERALLDLLPSSQANENYS